jgi:hypothetical protein
VCGLGCRRTKPNAGKERKQVRSRTEVESRLVFGREARF